MPDADSPAPTPPAAGGPPELQGLDPGELLARGLHTVKPSVGSSGWEPPEPEEVGRLLPQYRIEKLIGRGGMGAVYKGIQLNLDRPVAIKLLPAEMAADQEFVARFEREARTLARLQHSRIVTIYDFGRTAEGHLYFVMEFIDGTNLREILRGPGLDPEQALVVVGQLCDALQTAHREGIVHRDIKPENVLITKDGYVKLADFGLARPPRDDDTSALTNTNMVMGTPEYMSPEQRMGATKADHRSDIFALGVMLYEMLTGQTPRGVFDLPSRKVQVDVRIDEVVLKALQSEPDRRYQLASELKHDVDHIRNTPPPAAKPPEKKAVQERRPVVLFAVAGFVLLLCVAGWLLTTRRGAPPASAIARVPLASTEHPFVNSLGLSFVPVPRTGVLFCTTPVRVSDFRKFVAETGYDATADGFSVQNGYTTKGGSWLQPGFEQGEDHPVVSVSWFDARAFCAWLSKKENRTYRLPTDREWSCALGIDDMEDPNATPEASKGLLPGRYLWGTQWPPPAGVGNLPDLTLEDKYPGLRTDHLTVYRDGYANTSPVTAFKPTPLGLYDMEGNVFQWCEDWFNAQHDRRVVRGISFCFGRESSLSVSHRSAFDATARMPSNGFRCVLDSAEPALAPTTLAAREQPATRAPVAPSANGQPDTAGTESNPLRSTKEKPFVNSLGMRFVPLPAADQRNGTASTNGVASPQVLFGIWLVRVQDYAVYAHGHNVNVGWLNQQRDGEFISREPLYPVVGISWEEGQAFCRWLTEKEMAAGGLPRNARYRFPTDEEWSRAVGLPAEEGATPAEKKQKDQVHFPWGLGFPPPRAAVGNYADTAWHDKFPNERWLQGYSDGFATTSPVGSFPPNAYGIYDLGGNVWEYCEDWFDASRTDRVLRGGAWCNSDYANLLSSQRFHGVADGRGSISGLRCVLELGGASPAPASADVPKQESAAANRTWMMSVGIYSPTPAPTNAPHTGPAAPSQVPKPSPTAISATAHPAHESPSPESDVIPLHSVWHSEDSSKGIKYALHILERQGDTFRARFEVDRTIVREVTGLVKENTISWLAKDVRVISGGSTGGDNSGTISGHKINFTWHDVHGESGTFTLVRVEEQK